MGYNFTEQNYIIGVKCRYNDEKHGHIVWTTSIAAF